MNTSPNVNGGVARSTRLASPVRVCKGAFSTGEPPPESLDRATHCVGRSKARRAAS